MKCQNQVRMEKGVCAKGRFRAKRIVFLVISVVVVLLLGQSVFATLITPQNIVLEDFSSTQEQVITVINDQFEPIACEIQLDYLSLYLQDFLVFEPERFILQPGEQKNVKVVSSFPSNLSPQLHKVIVHASKTDKGNSTLSFRPPGTKKSKLVVSNIIGNESGKESSEDIIISLELENEGNAVLFVTPSLQIRQNNNLVKEIVYPQSIIILPGKSYPLTLRQDSSELAEGNYQISIKALYHDNEEEFFSEEQKITYVLSRASVNNTNSSQGRNIIIGLIIGAFGTIALIWFKPKNHRLNYRKKDHTPAYKELHQLSSVKDLKHEVYRLKKEVTLLTKEITVVVEQSEIKHNKNSQNR